MKISLKIKVVCTALVCAWLITEATQLAEQEPSAMTSPLAPVLLSLEAEPGNVAEPKETIIERPALVQKPVPALKLPLEEEPKKHSSVVFSQFDDLIHELSLPNLSNENKRILLSNAAYDLLTESDDLEADVLSFLEIIDQVSPDAEFAKNEVITIYEAVPTETPLKEKVAKYLEDNFTLNATDLNHLRKMELLVENSDMDADFIERNLSGL